jgi:hypothetical protein
MGSVKSRVGAWVTAALAAACLDAGAAHSADGTSGKSTGTGEGLQEVVVSTDQPGPGLWKVSKGDHVLWPETKRGSCRHRPSPSSLRRQFRAEHEDLPPCSASA